jgi:transposase
MTKLHANARTCSHCRSLIVSRVTDDHQTPAAVATAFRVTERTVRKWVTRFRAAGPGGLVDRSCRPNRIARRYVQPAKDLHDAVFSVLHTPPSQHGFNRTTWKLADLRNVLRAQGTISTPRSISAVIKSAGYRWKQARVTLTSSDPDYRNKLDGIRFVLSRLQDDEAFFSIDEFGPFAVKMRGGKSLCAPGDVRMVPQWQKSKGSLIVTAALELSRNQITHFYSERKNSGETIKLVELLRDRSRAFRRIYLSWDAAPWHSSKELKERVAALNGSATADRRPEIVMMSLPAGAQFLNVIESVFSGMARAIIHNSDYGGVADAEAAISRYFDERNAAFLASPRRAGRAIWGKERVPSTFLDSNNCKDPRYR